MFALASEGCHARLGIAVSKRNIRLAVERNRIKRLVRESFRTSSIRDLALDIVILPRSTTVDATPERLRQALASRWDSLRTFLNHHKPSPTQAD